jgi:hypothetical protein
MRVPRTFAGCEPTINARHRQKLRERLSALVAHDEARIVVLLDSPGWRETTGVIAAGSQREPLDLDR